jgi:CheY-like chemotaxis protein
MKECDVGKNIQILIVEDEVLLSAWIKMQLEDEGLLVCGSITTGEEAIEFVKKTKPDIILIDIHLAGEIDGIKAAEALNKKSNIPIIFMTGYGEPEIKERAQKLDPVAYLNKPVEMLDLKPVLDLITK